MDMDTQLTNLLHQKLKELNAIYELTVQQTDLMVQEDLTPLLDNIEKRQSHIDAIEQLDKQIEEASDNCYDAAHEQAAQRTHQAVYTAMRTVLEQVMEQDEKNSGTIQKLIEENQSFMRTNRQSIKGVQAYSAPMATAGGLYIDKSN